MHCSVFWGSVLVVSCSLWYLCFNRAPQLNQRRLQPHRAACAAPAVLLTIYCAAAAAAAAAAVAVARLRCGCHQPSVKTCDS
jgi:hypothetical protein